MRTKQQTQLTTVSQDRHASSRPTLESTIPTPKTIRHYKADYIFIPADLRSALLPTIPAISARLSHIFAYKELKTFGDLHGLRLSEIRNYRNCWRHTILELEALVKEVQGTLTDSDLRQRPAYTEPPPPPPNLFSVPPVARDLTPLDLPLSVRAENSLKKLGIQRLEDLEGVTMSKLKDLKYCGKWTIREIQTLLQRAGTGEFSFTPETLQKMTSFDLLAQMDERLGKLPQRDLEIVALRLGGSGQPPATLATIGAQFNITRERVRQIVPKVLGKFVRCEGPIIKALLNRMAATCHNRVHPLTPALLLKWAPKPWPLRYKPAFYLRVIAVMRLDVSPWPEGQKRDRIPA